MGQTVVSAVGNDADDSEGSACIGRDPRHHVAFHINGDSAAVLVNGTFFGNCCSRPVTAGDGPDFGPQSGEQGGQAIAPFNVGLVFDTRGIDHCFADDKIAGAAPGIETAGNAKAQ